MLVRPAPRPRARLAGGRALLKAGDGLNRFGAAVRTKEIDRLDLPEPLLDRAQSAPDWVARCREGRRPSARLPQEAGGLRRDRGVVGCAGAPKQMNEVVITIRTHHIGGEHRRVPAQCHDLGSKALEILALAVVVRQHVHRIARGERADFLEPAPGLDAGMRWMGRELMSQQ
jgi:hypothetical protein